MRTNKAGIDIIKEFEGLRLKAYKCPAAVWTIGYGHTSMAGPPSVKMGMVITKAEADSILKRDLVKYENGVKDAIRVEVTPNQFAACVSLCYNIGIGAFKKSSVARFCNARQWQKAADAFMLWNKAGGRVLPGLTRRRAAEAALFSRGNVKSEVRPVIDEPKGKSMMLSSTNLAAGATAAAGVTAAARETIENASGLVSSPLFLVFLMLVILAGAGWIVHERYKKARDWDV
jgi:lysozyme